MNRFFHAIYLAFQYQRHHKVRSLLLTLGVSVAVFLPAFTWSASSWLEDQLMSRARSSPILIGHKGNEFDLVMAAAYFRGSVGDTISYGTLSDLEERGNCEALPLHVGHSAQNFPVVGTELGYEVRRRLSVVDGRSFAVLGEVVLGWEVAKALELGPGDTLQSDLINLYNIAGSYPFILDVVGVYGPSGTPDDRAVFTDGMTTWLLDGHFHGHAEIALEDALGVPDEGAGNLEASAAVFMLNRLDTKSRASFHQHGDPAELPVSALLVFPADDRGYNQVLGDYAVSELLQAVEPTQVIQEVFAIVLRLEKMLGVGFGMVAASTVCLLVVVVSLSLRLRQAEIRLLQRMGCSKGTLVGLVVAELLLVLTAAIVVAAVLVAGANEGLKWYIELS